MYQDNKVSVLTIVPVKTAPVVVIIDVSTTERLYYYMVVKAGLQAIRLLLLQIPQQAVRQVVVMLHILYVQKITNQLKLMLQSLLMATASYDQSLHLLMLIQLLLLILLLVVLQLSYRQVSQVNTQVRVYIYLALTRLVQRLLKKI